ncbi:DUF2778 domain-containing protein [Candidatus Parcubacteria bacterium]|nr:MAG: DUF2778 domain-containing protein [Candidatus Parcubacteria bacterium]
MIRGAYGRGSYQIHPCGNVETCSMGCIATPSQFEKLDELLTEDEGDNVLFVRP